VGPDHVEEPGRIGEAPDIRILGRGEQGVLIRFRKT
jgi:hypothetical protein